MHRKKPFVYDVTVSAVESLDQNKTLDPELKYRKSALCEWSMPDVSNLFTFLKAFGFHTRDGDRKWSPGMKLYATYVWRGVILTGLVYVLVTTPSYVYSTVDSKIVLIEKIIATAALVTFPMFWIRHQEMNHLFATLNQHCAKMLSESDEKVMVQKVKQCGQCLMTICFGITAASVSIFAYDAEKAYRVIYGSKSGNLTIVLSNAKDFHHPGQFIVHCTLRIVVFVLLAQLFLMVIFSFYVQLCVMLKLCCPVPIPVQGQKMLRPENGFFPFHVVMAKWTSKMLQFKKQHTSLLRLIARTNDVFTEVLFLWMTSAIAVTCFMARCTIARSIGEGHVIAMVHVPIHLLFVCAAVAAAANVNNKLNYGLANFPGTTDDDMDYKTYDEQTLLAMDVTIIYIKRFLANPGGLTAWGLIYITKRSVFKMLETIFGYSILLLNQR